jgi:hypothetical protein
MPQRHRPDGSAKVEALQGVGGDLERELVGEGGADEVAGRAHPVGDLLAARLRLREADVAPEAPQPEDGLGKVGRGISVPRHRQHLDRRREPGERCVVAVEEQAELLIRAELPTVGSETVSSPTSKPMCTRDA